VVNRYSGLPLSATRCLHLLSTLPLSTLPRWRMGSDATVPRISRLHLFPRRDGWVPGEQQVAISRYIPTCASGSCRPVRLYSSSYSPFPSGTTVTKSKPAIMLTSTIATGLTLLVAGAAAFPTPSPIELMRRGPNPGIVITKCTNPGMLALAYDDGPYTYTSTLIDILDKAGAKGTFFWTGTLYGCIYKSQAAVEKAYKSGHQIASHSWTHGHMGGMSAANIKTEMTKVEDALVNMIGIKPAYMRPPYLETSGQFLPTMKTMNYKVITNDVDSGDWNNQSPAQSQSVFTRAGSSGAGHIPLMHETYASTVNTLTPWLINWAKTNNLKLVTVGEYLPAYFFWLVLLLGFELWLTV